MYRLKGGKWSTIHDCNSDIAPWTSYDTLGSKFCILLEVVLLYPLTVKSILFVRCYEQQATFCLHDIISGQNGRRGKTEHQRIVCFSILYQVIRSLLSSLLNSQFAGGNQQVMSAFQHEMTTVLVLVTSDATWFIVHAYKWQYRISFFTIRPEESQSNETLAFVVSLKLVQEKAYLTFQHELRVFTVQTVFT